jgi:NAD(P)-dependent dehydrogenase (short-subunit alcohol dehydrogenase family)
MSGGTPSATGTAAPESAFRPDLLRGKVAFVAGGTSGINLAIAEALARHGAAVAVMSRAAEKVERAVAQLRALGATAMGGAGDVRRYDEVEGVMTDAHRALGPLDIVVSGAAGNFLCPAEQLSPNGFRTVVEIDLLGTFHVLRCARGLTRTPGASFLNVSAPQSTQAYWGQAHVSAAKAGVDMLTRSLAVEWGPAGIRVNAIVPGPIGGTEGIDRLAPTEAIRDAWTATNPLRRFGTGREVADVALFLCSEAAAYVNGSVVYCDGGQVLASARDYRASWEATARSRNAGAPATTLNGSQEG